MHTRSYKLLNLLKLLTSPSWGRQIVYVLEVASFLHSKEWYATVRRLAVCREYTKIGHVREAPARRKGRYIGESCLRREDARCWATAIERDTRTAEGRRRRGPLRGPAVRTPTGVPGQVIGGHHDAIADANLHETNADLGFGPPDQGRMVTKTRPWIDQYEVGRKLHAPADANPRAALGYVDEGALSRNSAITDIDRAAVAITRMASTVSAVRAGIEDRRHDPNARRGSLTRIIAQVATCCLTRS